MTKGAYTYKYCLEKIAEKEAEEIVSIYEKARAFYEYAIDMATANGKKFEWKIYFDPREKDFTAVKEFPIKNSSTWVPSAKVPTFYNVVKAIAEDDNSSCDIKITEKNGVWIAWISISK